MPKRPNEELNALREEAVELRIRIVLLGDNRHDETELSTAKARLATVNARIAQIRSPTA